MPTFNCFNNRKSFLMFIAFFVEILGTKSVSRRPVQQSPAHFFRETTQFSQVLLIAEVQSARRAEIRLILFDHELTDHI